ncbi:hypothetical protein JW826_03185 [Candidatus Woesearchaeota archaeon]|nr:hypothetical protein [Candidatus Woesearchaeota archaeon]
MVTVSTPQTVYAIRAGQDPLEFCMNLSREFYAGKTRRSGRPYFEHHLEPLARFAEEVFIPRGFRDPVLSKCLESRCSQDLVLVAKAAAYLHDYLEDNPALLVRDPESGETAPWIGNSLFALLHNAEQAGKDIATVVGMLTYDCGTYREYMEKLYSFQKDAGNPHDYHLRVLVAVLKTKDRQLNVDPEEIENETIRTREEIREQINRLALQYLSLDDDPKMMISFLKRTRTLGPFIIRKNLKKDVHLFTSALAEQYAPGLFDRATDSLSLYLPMAEKLLLQDVGVNNRIFRWDVLRDTIMQSYREALQITGRTGAKGIGNNKRSPSTPLLDEIAKETASLAEKTQDLLVAI